MPEQIHIGPDGTRFKFVATMTTTPTSDAAPKPVTVKFKTFWKTTRQWTDADIADYHHAIPQLAEQIRTEKYWGRSGNVRTNRFTCEDFVLRVLVQFAASRGLPLKLTTGVRTYRNMEVHGEPEHERYDSTLYGFADMVALTYGARDMQRTGLHTIRVTGPESLLPGDILAQANDIEGAILAGRRGASGNDAHHIQLVASKAPNKIGIYQGNSSGNIHIGARHVLKVLGHNSADPQDSRYGGMPVETGSYTLNRGGSWDYENHTTGSQYNDKLREFEFYRWNFKEFNK